MKPIITWQAKGSIGHPARVHICRNIAVFTNMAEASHSFFWKSAHPHFWSYRVKVYLNEPPLWNKFCMGNQSTLLECWETQRQVLCISEKTKLRVTLLRVTLCCSQLTGPYSLGTPCSRWYFTIQSVLCCQNLRLYPYVLHFTLVSVVTGGWIHILTGNCRFCYICHRKL